MIQTSKDRAIVITTPTSQRLQKWVESKDEYIIQIGKGEPKSDLAIVEGQKKKANASKVAAIRPKQYNKQQNWYKAGKPLKEWSGQLFHLQNPLIAALWTCGKAGIKEILFADVRPDIQKKHKRNQFRDVGRKLLQEFSLSVFYNDRRANLFKEIGGKKFKIEEENSTTTSVEIPDSESIFANNFETDWIDSVSSPLIRYEKNVVGAVVDLDDRTITSTSVIPKDLERVEGEGILVLDPTKVLRATNTFGNVKEIYIINEETNRKIQRTIKRHLENESNSPLLQTVLAFAIGGNFHEIETQGIKERIGKASKKLIKNV